MDREILNELKVMNAYLMLLLKTEILKAEDEDLKREMVGQMEEVSRKYFNYQESLNPMPKNKRN